MISLSDIAKTFFTKIYIFMIVFLLIFGISNLADFSAGNNTMLNNEFFVSNGEVSVSSSQSNDSIQNLMNNAVYQAKNDRFLNLALQEISYELSKDEGKFSNLNESGKHAVQTLKLDDLQKNFSVEIVDKTTIFRLSFKHRTNRVAQAVNDVIINTFYNTLESGDSENILGAFGVQASYSISKNADLPQTTTTSLTDNEGSLSIFMTIVISFLVYVVIVILYDFAMAYVTSRQKAKTMVRTEIIADIEMPYLKNRKIAKPAEGEEQV